MKCANSHLRYRNFHLCRRVSFTFDDQLNLISHNALQACFAIPYHNIFSLCLRNSKKKNGDNRGLKKMRRVFRWLLCSFLIHFRLFMAIVCKTIPSLPISLCGIFKVLCIKDDNLVKWFTVTTYLWNNQCSVISCPCKHCLVAYSVSKMNLWNDNSNISTTLSLSCWCVFTDRVGSK